MSDSDHESDILNDNIQNVDLTNKLKGTVQTDVVSNDVNQFSPVDNAAKERLNSQNNQTEDSNGLDNEQIESTPNGIGDLKDDDLHGNAMQHNSTLNNSLKNDAKLNCNEMAPVTPTTDEQSSLTETESSMTDSPQHETPATPSTDRLRRVNPFNSLETEPEADSWLAQQSTHTSDLDRMIRQHADSISPKKVPLAPQIEENISVNDRGEVYTPQFELMPQKTAKSQMENYEYSGIEDIEAAVREVNLQNNSPKTPPPIDNPWVKLPQNQLPNKPPSPVIPNITPVKETTPYNSIPNLPKKHEALKIDSPFINQTKPQPKPETSQSYVRPLIEAPGPCDPEDLIEGIIFTANYLGSTQLVSEKNQGKNSRMLQAQEAVGRIKAPEGESQPSVEVDLFVSADKVKIMNADTQETMMDHSLRSISYIADIGKLLVIMAKRKQVQVQQSDEPQLMREPKPPRSYKVICHVFSSMDSQLMAQAIGQAFNVAYQQFLTANGIEPQTLTRDDYNKLLDLQEMYHDDLVHYSKQENIKDMWIEKKKGENLGVVIVESGWGSIVPTVILANLQHGGPAERCGKLSIGDQIMTINGTSLVGLSLSTCQSIIKGLRMQSIAHLNIVSCPPVVTVLIKRPDLKYQLGFSVQEGIICSLMRGGIAERGGVRVGHRIIEINGLSVVATQHDKIVQMLVSSVGEIQMKTMPATMYRLLTGQEQPVYI